MSVSNGFWRNYIERKEVWKLTNENQTRGKPAGKCIECGKQVWYPTALFCKDCSIKFYNGENAREALKGEKEEKK